MKISPRQPPKKTRCGDKSFKLTLACCLAILLIAVFGGIGTLIAVLKEAPARIQRIPHGGKLNADKIQLVLQFVCSFFFLFFSFFFFFFLFK